MIEQALESARAGLVRVTAAEAFLQAQAGAVLVDIRPEFQRVAGGELPGAIVIERVHLEWRCDPLSYARIPEAVDHDVRWIICCEEGYSSSLAAASLRSLGLHHATDIIDGFIAWRAAGLPILYPDRPAQPRLYSPPAPAFAPAPARDLPPAPAVPRQDLALPHNRAV
jgi:rhodanese-related sulfurtransferase